MKQYSYKGQVFRIVPGSGSEGEAIRIDHPPDSPTAYVGGNESGTYTYWSTGSGNVSVDSLEEALNGACERIMKHLRYVERLKGVRRNEATAKKALLDYTSTLPDYDVEGH